MCHSGISSHRHLNKICRQKFSKSFERKQTAEIIVLTLFFKKIFKLAAQVVVLEKVNNGGMFQRHLSLVVAVIQVRCLVLIYMDLAWSSLAEGDEQLNSQTCLECYLAYAAKQFVVF